MTKLLPYSAKRKAACGLRDDYYITTTAYAIPSNIMLKDFELVDVDFTLVFLLSSL